MSRRQLLRSVVSQNSYDPKAVAPKEETIIAVLATSHVSVMPNKLKRQLCQCMSWKFVMPKYLDG